MQKRGLAVVTSVITLLLLLPLASAQFYSMTRPSRTLPYYSKYLPAQNGPLMRVLELPDLAIEHVNLPDTLPYGALLGIFDITVRNKGSAPAQGFVKVKVDIDLPNAAGCGFTAELSGGSGHRDPRYYGYTSGLRYLSLLPNRTFTMPLMDRFFGRYLSPSSSCRRPLTDDVTVRIRVNPAGGGTLSGIRSKPRLKESNYENNYFEKTIRVGIVPDENTIHRVDLAFARGMNAFSIPVVMNMSSGQFIQQSGCTLYTMRDRSVRYGTTTRGLDLRLLRLMGMQEKLEPGTPYFAECLRSTAVRFQGRDPGAFHQELVPITVNPAPTRAAMRGKYLYELLGGCSRLIGNSGAFQTQIFGYVPGTRNVVGKIMTEALDPRLQVVPGQLYLVSCGSSYGGVWDPEGGTNRRSERLLKEFIPRSGAAFGSGRRYSSRFGQYRGRSYGNHY